ncbi:MAG: sulfotransferase [Nitrospirae bacterium]|nr:sulfotransferase [Magnetococcales bacterium]
MIFIKPIPLATATLNHFLKGCRTVLIPVLRLILLFVPHHGPTRRTLGHLLVENKRYAEALPSLQHLLASGQATGQIYADLAQVYFNSQRLTAAEKSLRSALALEPTRASWWLNLGVILTKRQHREAAIHAFEKAILADPNKIDPLFFLANEYLNPSHTDALRVEALCRQALKINPHHEGCLNFLAVALGLLGRLDEAITLNHHILHHFPNNAPALGNLAALGALPTENQEIPWPDTNYGPPHERAYHPFAMAKIHKKNKNHTAALACYQAGNAIMRQSFPYEISEDILHCERIRAVFNPQFFADRPQWGIPSDKPIFILGMPRSGTTLIEQILATHPQCHGGGERNEIYELVDSMGIFSKEHQAYPEATRELRYDEVKILGQSYVQSLTLLNHDAPRITDKKPHNFLHVGLIHLLLPNARIIHCRRHPMDTCLSCYEQLFADHHPYAYDLTELGKYYRNYHDLMQHWQKTLPGRMLEIHYEEVIRHPEAMIRRILDHCALAWDERCLDFHLTQRPVETASHIEVRQPLYKTSVGRWRMYEEQLQPLRHALGDVFSE